MTPLPALYLRMLRYRVAAMIWMFMLLGVALHGEVTLGLALVAASLVLACSYVCATCLNDIADEDVDRINHPGDAGRPLVVGAATRTDLWTVAVAAGLVTLLAAVPLGPQGIAVAVASLALAHAYSLSPVRLSYRTYLALVGLSIAYVVVPYALGVVVADASPGVRDIVLCSGLFLLFYARINLKDFRDRAGDAAYGKPTFLLRFGKDATCATSAATLAIGSILILIGLDGAVVETALLAIFPAAIFAMLHRLWRSTDEAAEQIAIGLGARMGNGFLISCLTLLLLRAAAAPLEHRIVVLALLAVVYGGSVGLLAIRPQEIVIGYKA